MKVDLYHQRIGYLTQLACTLGIMTAMADGKTLTYATIEQPPLFDAPYSAGHPDHSCICDGDFQMVEHYSTAHPNAIALVNPAYGIFHEPGDIPAGLVYARWGCLIHNANLARQLAGCIAIGRNHVIMMDTVIGQHSIAVDHSEDCLTELLAFLEGKELGQLHIRPTVGYAFGGSAMPPVAGMSFAKQS